jgi:pimeloyl-ACP methyl ester carboxylesterase
MTALQEIVLLPGLDGTGELFDRVVPLLEAETRVTVLRYPGNPVIGPALGYEDYAQFVRDQIGDRHVVLLGESFSGPIAVMVAGRHPARVMGVILAATFLQCPYAGWLVRLGAPLNPCLAPGSLRDRILMGRYGDAALHSKIADILAAMPPGVREARLDAVSRVDVRKTFAGLSCPVLALHGNADWLVPKGPLERAVRHKAGARMVVLPGAAHMLLQTRTRDAGQHILSFLRGINGTGGKF